MTLSLRVVLPVAAFCLLVVAAPLASGVRVRRDGEGGEPGAASGEDISVTKDGVAPCWHGKKTKGADKPCDCAWDKTSAKDKEAYAPPAPWDGDLCQTIKEEFCNTYGDCCEGRKKFCPVMNKNPGHDANPINKYDTFHDKSASATQGAGSEGGPQAAGPTGPKSPRPQGPKDEKHIGAGNSGDHVSTGVGMTKKPKIMISLTTYNRYATSALAILGLINSDLKEVGAEIHVWDDKSKVDAEPQKAMFRDLEAKGLIKKYHLHEKNQGFLKTRAAVVNYFLENREYTHWYHTDDDLLVGSNFFKPLVQDYFGWMKNKGMALGYVAHWAPIKMLHRGPLSYYAYGGAPCFLMSRDTIDAIGNPYEKYMNGGQNTLPDGLSNKLTGSNWYIFKLLREKGMLPMGRRTKDAKSGSYNIQHFGAMTSALYGVNKGGMDEQWFMHEPTSKKVLQVEGFNVKEIREAFMGHKMIKYLQTNMGKWKNKLKLAEGEGEGKDPRGSSGSMLLRA